MTDRPETRSLDRALARARTPQVPAGLAARIVDEVTRLPQQSPIEAPAPAPAKLGGNRYWRLAGTAALALMLGAATLVLRSAPEAQHGEQVALVQKMAPAPAGQPEANLAVASVRSGAVVTADINSPKHAPAASDDAPAPPVPEATELAVAPAPTFEPAPTVAQQGAIRPATTVVEPLPASSQVYGPSAPSQGLGITSGSSVNMPRSGPVGSAGPGGHGGPPHR